MTKSQYRIAVVGAASLLGKEIADELAESSLSDATVVLLDEGDASGRLEAVGDEASFVQQLEAGAFENADVAIFADAAMLREYDRTAQQLGSAVVDATGMGDASAVVRAPMLGRDAFTPLNLETNAIRAAHPVATMLALALRRIATAGEVKWAAATVLQPASEMGTAGVDELQAQTVSLLSFQTVSQAEFDAQSAFNLLPALGDAAKRPLIDTEDRIARDLEALLGGTVVAPALQLVQAPVFHGFGVSLLFEAAAGEEALRRALSTEPMELVDDDGEPPTNVAVAGDANIQMSLRADTSAPGRFALWMVADNLKLAARTAVGCAVEMARLRPLGKVQ